MFLSARFTNYCLLLCLISFIHKTCAEGGPENSRTSTFVFYQTWLVLTFNLLLIIMNYTEHGVQQALTLLPRDPIGEENSWCL